MDVNANYMSTYSALSRPTLYPSAYMVVNSKGYTKHYYAGAERVAARIGGGGLDALISLADGGDSLRTKASHLFTQSIGQVNNRVLENNEPDCITGSVAEQDELKVWIEGIPEQLQASTLIDYGEFTDVIQSLRADHNGGQEREVYFYHSDHLGSASWITDSGGQAIQHLQYLPYGEPYINQRTSGYNERFTFTGKERDEETGYGYFGARYMDYELMTMWLSVDPMADKYPSISPYAYCAWNPVKLVDPDGKELYINVNNTKYYLHCKWNYNNGNWDLSWRSKNGKKLDVKTDIFAKAVTNSIQQIMGSKTGASLVKSLIRNKNECLIVPTDEGKSSFNAKNTSISFEINPNYELNPSLYHNLVEDKMESANKDNCPIFISLAHEFAHCADIWLDIVENRNDLWGCEEKIPNAEKFATCVENRIRHENNLPERVRYGRHEGVVDEHGAFWTQSQLLELFSK